MAGRQIRKREEIEGTEGHGAGGAGAGQQRVQGHEPERRNGQERDLQQDLQMRGRSPGRWRVRGTEDGDCDQKPEGDRGKKNKIQREGITRDK